MADYWEVHFEIIGSNHNAVSVGKLAKIYNRKGNAERAGKEFCKGIIPRARYWLVGREYRRYNNGRCKKM